MPSEPNINAGASKANVTRAVATAWRVVASLAVLAALWTVLQSVSAIRAGGSARLLPSALLAYSAGIGYLAATATIALRFDKSIRIRQAVRHSPLFWIAHAVVVGSAVLLARRGVDARGVLVGLGTALVAWSVVALVALVVEAASWLVRRRPDNPAAATSPRPITSIASACFACAAVLGLGLVYLESRPLPNLPSKHHVPTGLEAESAGSPRDASATREETPGPSPSAPAGDATSTRSS